MKLRHNPFQVFHGSRTPAGLYARQKWLQEADTPAWQTDFEETVDIYAGLQNDDGEWGKRLPFYQTVNALAHLDLPEAEAQLERAFARLLGTQNRDGSWGRHDKEWNTFLCIHALRNKGIL